MEENLSAKIPLSFLSIYEKNVTCKRDPEARDRDVPTFLRDRDETETLGKCVSRPSRDRDVETETTSLLSRCKSVHYKASGYFLNPVHCPRVTKYIAGIHAAVMAMHLIASYRPRSLRAAGVVG